MDSNYRAKKMMIAIIKGKRKQHLLTDFDVDFEDKQDLFENSYCSWLYSPIAQKLLV